MSLYFVFTLITERIKYAPFSKVCVFVCVFEQLHIWGVSELKAETERFYFISLKYGAVWTGLNERVLALCTFSFYQLFFPVFLSSTLQASNQGSGTTPAFSIIFWPPSRLLWRQRALTIRHRGWSKFIWIHTGPSAPRIEKKMKILT